VSAHASVIVTMMTTVVARAVSLLALLAVIAPSLAGALAGHALALPAWAMVPPGVKLSLLLLAPAILLSGGEQLKASHVLAGLCLTLSALMLVAGGVAALRTDPVGAGSLIDWLRPTVLTTLGIAALAASLIWRRVPAISLDASALLGAAACAVFSLVAVGHLYGAAALTADPASATGASSGSGIVLLLAVSLSALATHGGGPMMAYLGEDAGAVAKRRLLPAAVLTPLAAGFLLLYAMHGGGMSPALAVAVTVFANVAVMLLLINGAGNKVAAVAQAKEEKLEARAAAARRQGTRDALTGLLNRRGWDLAVQAAERRCRAEALDACVLMIDLDGLKRVNDTQGHKAGDALIQAAASALKKAARRGDALARLGGDEFACLVVDCDEEMAQAVTARFEQALASAAVPASVGHALAGDGALASAIETADQAMYQAKRARKLRRA
jgi:diguanylate cyclase (GGDEF)-like protein